MIEQNSSTPAFFRLELSNNLSKMIRSLKKLDNNTLYAKVITPDLFDQFCIMFALDKDSTAASHTCAILLDCK